MFLPMGTLYRFFGQNAMGINKFFPIIFHEFLGKLISVHEATHKLADNGTMEESK